MKKSLGLDAQKKYLYRKHMKISNPICVEGFFGQGLGHRVEVQEFQVSDSRLTTTQLGMKSFLLSGFHPSSHGMLPSAPWMLVGTVHEHGVVDGLQPRTNWSFVVGGVISAQPSTSMGAAAQRSADDDAVMMMMGATAQSSAEDRGSSVQGRE